MRFEPHPMLPQAYFAREGKFSFSVMKHEDGWHTSWQDQVEGGSASSTMEGPFKSRDQAEANCRRIYKALLNKH